MLHEACDKGNALLAYELLRSIDTELNLKNEAGYAPLHCAVIKGHFEVSKLLLKSGANLLILTNYYETALHLAVAHQHFDILKLIIELNNDYSFVNARDLMGKTCLHYACKNGDVDTVKYILNQKADVLIDDIFYTSPLHVAAFYNHKEIVKLLIDCGVVVNAVDSVGFTPMNYANDLKYFEVSEILMQNDGTTYRKNISLIDISLLRQDYKDIIRRCYL